MAEREARKGAVSYVLMAIALAMALYHLVSTQYLVETSIGFRETHLCFALVIVFLVVFTESKQRWLSLLMIVFILLSLGFTVYLKIFGEELEWMCGSPSLLDSVVGWVIIFLVLEGCRRAWGMILPVLGLLAIAYMLLGSHLPGILRSPPITPEHAISFLSIGHIGTGVFGMLLSASAKYIFLFVLFGGLIQATGASMFFQYLGKLVARVAAGGPALAAVVSSGMVGMIVGAPAANVAITGAYTIPTMKSYGYKPEVAAGVEACASTGGAIMPPVMGGTAFLMAELTGLPYIKICAMALIPAFLYYFVLGIQAQLEGLKLRRRLQAVPVKEAIDYKHMALTSPFFWVPLLVITVLLVIGFSPMYAAFWGIISELGVAVVMKPVRPKLKDVINGFARGATGGARIALACAAVGIIVKTMTATGLGVRLPQALEVLSGGNLLLGLLLTALVTFILGCGVPGLAAYVLSAVIMGPALLKIIMTAMAVPMDMAMPMAHLFILFWSVFAAITPPVAIASLVGAGIANASYVKSALEGAKFGYIAFFLPFFFIWRPELIMQFTDPLGAVLTIICILVGSAYFCLFLRGFYRNPLNISERALILVGAGLLFGFVFTRWYPVLGIGLIILAIVTLWHTRRWKQQKPATSP